MVRQQRRTGDRDYVQVLDSLRGRHGDYVQVLDSLRRRHRDYVQVLDSLRRRHRDYVQVLDSLRRRHRDYVQVSGRKWAGSGTGSSDRWPCCSSATTEEERGDAGPDGGSGEMEAKRTRLDGSVSAPSTGCTEDATLTNRERVPGSCDEPGSESCSTGSASGVSDGVSSRLPPAEHGEVMKRDVIARCDITPEAKRCNVFQEHMTGSEHLRRLNDITQCISVKTHTLQDRGRRPETPRWCDTCQTHFSGDVITHRQTKQHKVCKQLCRPFCPVCKRHFRTPRKFVEHMKSAEHKQQVHLEEAQEEELITVDAVGCFEEEEEEEVDAADGEEEEEEVVDVADGEEEEEEVVDVADGEEEEEEVVDVADGEEEEEEVVDVADGEEEGVGRDDTEDKVLEVPEASATVVSVLDERCVNAVCLLQAADAQETHREAYDPHTIYGSSFVVPVAGFLCRLCNKFFHRETTARHTHCRTHTHYLNLQG
ncbi:Zinc finger protein 1 [Collichthys lucidus]|uniref:Zinc finger protein 1 n=1 Tax=Collichthys lucidus TaxID=240159 RepID=A0A4U5TWY3_COLLU|nr:Zinc finger protein 1 [Collichthys lucidus]